MVTTTPIYEYRRIGTEFTRFQDSDAADATNQHLPMTFNSWIFEGDDPSRRGRFRQRPRKLQIMATEFRYSEFQVHDARDMDDERISHLNNCLPHWIRAQMSRLVIHSRLYRRALAELYKRYGS